MEVSYHRSQRHSLGAVSTVSVGASAYKDPYVARASLLASKIMLKMAQAPAASRLNVMESALNQLDASYTPAVAAQMQALLKKGKTPDQAAYDAMRVVFANDMMERDLTLIRHTQGAQRGWDQLVDTPLGDIDPNTQQAACVAASAGSVAGGVVSIIPVYGTIIGAALSIGSSVASGALNCNAGQQALQQQTAQAQAAQAAAINEQAAAAAQAQQQREQTYIRAAEIGGAVILGLLAFNWLLD